MKTIVDSRARHLGAALPTGVRLPPAARDVSFRQLSFAGSGAGDAVREAQATGDGAIDVHLRNILHAAGDASALSGDGGGRSFTSLTRSAKLIVRAPHGKTVIVMAPSTLAVTDGWPR
jgi:hypothetical protein